MTARTGLLTVEVQRLAHGRGLPLPSYASAESAGLDLLAAVEADLVLAPGSRTLVPTGIAVALPPGFEGQLRPRSGLALKNGITVLNAPGTIDADYRGEVGVVLANLGTDSFTVTRGMRVAQLVIAPVARIAWREAEQLSPTARGAGGFGSTGALPSARETGT